MMQGLRTSELAKRAGVHPNTVRLYETWGFIPPVPRGANGYRQYSERHLSHLIFARIAFRCQFSAGSVRKRLTDIVCMAATGDLETADCLLKDYEQFLKDELCRAKAALMLVENWRSRQDLSTKRQSPTELEKGLSRRQAAEALGVSIDVLRNWELNGLIEVPREHSSRYRRYGDIEMQRLEVIRTLRMANHSLMAVLKMLRKADQNHSVFSYAKGEAATDLTYATDNWICALNTVIKDSQDLRAHLHNMQKETCATEL